MMEGILSLREAKFPNCIWPRSCRLSTDGDRSQRSEVIMSERHDGSQDTLVQVTSCFQTLVHLTSCFQQLAALLGSLADCAFLRREMAHARTLFADVANGLSRHLMHLLSDCDSGPPGAGASAERQALERVWVHFLAAAENFLRELRKAADLIGRFPLGQQKDRRALINAGCLDGMTGVTERTGAVQSPRLDSDEEGWGAGLQQHLSRLEAMISDMQLRVPVAFWSVETTQPSCGKVSDEAEDGLEKAAAAEPSICCWPPTRSGFSCAWS
ncbi:regulator of G-protein signaling 9-binding protein [Syngnathus scovelli]|uniref:regulator of G-protein signaling 9-binding protein n=1 Tax=Syngnathus scovelli TaxID=161590 RepID=UPI0021104D60|nr:regulator of G-protein signaling 9-binding protein [Syngnathus scovelli]